MRSGVFFAIFIVVVLRPSARADEPRVISPDRHFAVVTTASGAGEQEVSSYAIRARSTGRTLATCPRDSRFASTPDKVSWSPDSRFVAILTRTSRHGGVPDLWRVSASSASLIKVDLDKEDDADIYVTPKRWLNALELQCDVFGRSDSEHRRLHPKEPWVEYTLVLRLDPSSPKARVLRSPPKYPAQS